MSQDAPSPDLNGLQLWLGPDGKSLPSPEASEAPHGALGLAASEAHPPGDACLP